jgi:pimeloyl-ACP methyl ester carboxylesterase
LAPGERITVPAGVAAFPKELLPAPRAWTERQLADIRRWTEMPRGGHFAAVEEPELLVDDLIEFLDEL